MKRTIFPALFLVIAIAIFSTVSGCSLLPGTSPEKQPLSAVPQNTNIEKTPMVKNEPLSPPPAVSGAVSEAQYLPYSESLANTLIGKSPVALFFHASWCPTCRLENEIITANISDLPKGTVILKVDYDQETSLKQKYGITMQSIVVVLDSTGKEVGRIGDFKTITPLKNLIDTSFPQ